MGEKAKVTCQTMKSLRSKFFRNHNQNQITISPSYMVIRGRVSNNMGTQMEDIVVTVATGRASEASMILVLTCNLISSKI